MEACDALSGVLSVLRAVPIGPVELPLVSVVEQSGNGAFARLVAPRGIRADDVDVLPGPTFSDQGAAGVLCSLQYRPSRPDQFYSDELETGLESIALHTQAVAVFCPPGADPDGGVHVTTAPVVNLHAMCVNVTVTIPPTAAVGSVATLRSLSIAGEPIALGAPAPSFTVYSGPRDVTPAQAALLQTWVGGPGHPGTWTEVYRASRDGFDAAAFHSRCDGKPRLLTLVREKVHGWLFGGFTAVGFRSVNHGYYEDRAAFIFTLTNPSGVPPVRFASSHSKAIFSSPAYLIDFGGGGGDDLYIGNYANERGSSGHGLGYGYEKPAEAPVGHPLFTGTQKGWLVAEVVSFVVP